MWFHEPLARYVKLRVAHAPGMPETSSPPPRVSDPDMSWCILGSLTKGFLGGGENVCGIPGACATRNFTHLARGPCGWQEYPSCEDSPFEVGIHGAMCGLSTHICLPPCGSEVYECYLDFSCEFSRTYSCVLWSWWGVHMGLILISVWYIPNVTSPYIDIIAFGNEVIYYYYNISWDCCVVCNSCGGMTGHDHSLFKFYFIQQR